jgi:hypothetical protein
MANGHGGKRAGAGRPRKSLVDKLYEGTAKKHKPKVLNIPSLEDIAMPEPPDYLRTLNAGSISDKIPNMETFFSETAAWLEKTGCLHLINPDFITEYAVMKTRWLECEDFVSQSIIVKGKNGELMPNPMIEQSLKYCKAADIAWTRIWNIIAANSEVYFGDDPNADVMAFLIKNKPER